MDHDTMHGYYRYPEINKSDIVLLHNHIDTYKFDDNYVYLENNNGYYCNYRIDTKYHCKIKEIILWKDGKLIDLINTETIPFLLSLYNVGFTSDGLDRDIIPLLSGKPLSAKLSNLIIEIVPHNEDDIIKSSIELYSYDDVNNTINSINTNIYSTLIHRCTKAKVKSKLNVRNNYMVTTIYTSNYKDDLSTILIKCTCSNIKSLKIFGMYCNVNDDNIIEINKDEHGINDNWTLIELSDIDNIYKHIPCESINSNNISIKSSEEIKTAYIIGSNSLIYVNDSCTLLK